MGDVLEVAPDVVRTRCGLPLLHDPALTAAVVLPAAVAAHAHRDPSRVAIEVAGRSTTFAALHGRSSRLASVLRTFAGPGALVDVVCCAAHRDDLLVAYVACRAAGVHPCVHPPSDLAGTPGHEPVGGIACAAGTTAWQAAARRGWLVGDGPGVRWWRMLELQHPPLEPDGSHVVADEVDLIGEADVVHAGDIRTSLSALAAGVLQRVG